MTNPKELVADPAEMALTAAIEYEVVEVERL
eukprot:CAMPEP_0114583814 /NCGR_PEP_ID=MMETSP0125-20121206/7502_1 /TAXON_ID=485358 ORGANISM="Aristerostoma sp., Strain ATCC 50986" /NCGR_SAMPLE_ID=MMETSP0125 /ASSEMBLY_ACC=CAM_ASM_000245 /LENGTH=30 /DNA_ID= /DNA_START= /DNA_END= /DNA_ORIENTATION=